MCPYEQNGSITKSVPICLLVFNENRNVVFSLAKLHSLNKTNQKNELKKNRLHRLEKVKFRILVFAIDFVDFPSR